MTNTETLDNSVFPLVELIDIWKAFPGVQALKAASFRLAKGEIHALVGENGAGKSTLIKILTGVYQADKGTIKLNRQLMSFNSPLEAQHAGIATIYQEFTLVGTLTVRDNLFLGRERLRWGFIDYDYEYKQIESVFRKLGADINPDIPVAKLTVAEQQLTEIARALLANAKILVMDEPTAALAPREVERLFTILRDLAAQGIGIIFISHRLDEIFEIADIITVMRDGERIVTKKACDLNRRQLIEYMVGRAIEDEYPKTPSVTDRRLFTVRNLSGGRIRNISFEIDQGEVLGIAGLMGSGRTEVARLIYGADRKDSGEIFLYGKKLIINSPRDAIKQGICFLTEDRKVQGLVLKLSTKDNFALPNLKSWSRFGLLNIQQEKSRFKARVKELDIQTTGPDQPAAFLSGGNQQKLLIARWLETQSRVIMFDEPTRGIDVGAKYEMYQLINKLAAQGKAIIVISSELPEVLGISDRILVMRHGEITGEIKNAAKATQEDIMLLAV